MRRIITLIACIALPLIIGGISGFLTVSEISGWYTGLKKPSFNPPNYLFGPVWTVLYLLMGISLFLVLEAKVISKGKALTFFFVQLTLNFFWSIIFFKAHQVAMALADIAALWLCILMMIVTFYRISRVAGLLQIPYLLWVSFATLLNASILYLN